MPLPISLFALWALWPLMAFPGGKLFAAIIFLIGLYALRSLKFSQLSPPEKTGIGFLLWICISSLWSPANEGIFSGSLLEENFAVEASYLRFSLTIIGCVLFVRLVLRAANDKLDRVLVWMCAGILVHLAMVLPLGFAKDELLSAEGQPWVPTGQSMGRNLNLLTMAMPLVLGAAIFRWPNLKGLVTALVLLGMTVVSAILLDGLGALLALLIAGGGFVVLHFGGTRGFRVLFNSVAACLVMAPGLAWVLGLVAPGLVGHIPRSSQQRILMWQAAVERIQEAPLFGHGINAAPAWTETFATRPDMLAQLTPDLATFPIIPNHPHNMAIQIWSETGLVGVLLCAMILIMAGRRLPEPQTLSPSTKIAVSGLFGAAVAYFAVSYSAWDDSYWASIAIVMSGVIVLHRKSVQ